MPSLRELLEAEDTRWHELCALFDRIDDWEQPGATGDWTPKDVLAHVASWHAYAVDRLEEFTARGDFTRLAEEVDVVNQRFYEQCRDVTLHDARAMSGASRHRFREEAALLPAEVPEPLARMVAANGTEHYEEHIPLLTVFLEAQ